METSTPITIRSAVVRVESRHIPALFAALVKAAENTEAVYYPFPKTETIQDHLEQVWEWCAEIDNETGDIIRITPTRDAVNRLAMEAMLNTFAPFVKAMQPFCQITYREVYGDAIYRYQLDGNTANKQRGTLFFLDNSEQSEGEEEATLYKLADEHYPLLAKMIEDAWEKRNILEFVEDIYGPQADAIRISLLEKKGGYDVGAVHVYRQEQEILPDLQLPYWQRVIANDPDFLKGDMSLEAIYEHLYKDNVYLEYGIPVEETMRKWYLDNLWTAYPILYQQDQRNHINDAAETDPDDTSPLLEEAFERSVNIIRTLLINLADSDNDRNPESGEIYRDVMDATLFLDETLQSGLVHTNDNKDGIVHLIEEVKRQIARLDDDGRQRVHE